MEASTFEAVNTTNSAEAAFPRGSNSPFDIIRNRASHSSHLLAISFLMVISSSDIFVPCQKGSGQASPLN